jgi:hypothetical protein
LNFVVIVQRLRSDHYNLLVPSDPADHLNASAKAAADRDWHGANADSLSIALRDKHRRV